MAEQEIRQLKWWQNDWNLLLWGDPEGSSVVELSEDLDVHPISSQFLFYAVSLIRTQGFHHHLTPKFLFSNQTVS